MWTVPARLLLVLPFLDLLLTACDDPKPSPTAVAATPTSPAPPPTPPAASTPPVTATLAAVATSPAGPATPTAVVPASCASGWTLLNVPSRSYHLCLPPGWTAQLLSAAGSVATPVPSGSLTSEPVGSLVLALSPEQGSNTTPGGRK